MKTYTDWANEILKQVGTVGANKLIAELQKVVNDVDTNNTKKADKEFDAGYYQEITHNDYWNGR